MRKRSTFAAMMIFILLMLMESGAARKSPTSNTNGVMPNKSLSFQQYRSILTFNNEQKFYSVTNTNNETGAPIETQNDLWDTMLLDTWAIQEKMEMETKSKSSSPRHSNSIPTFPFVLCHLDKSNICGQERHELIESLLREEKGNSDVDFFLDAIPIYNYIFIKDENGKEKEKENTDKLNGACFYSSMTSSVARRISSHDTIYATPLSSSLKTRKSSFLNNLNEKDDSQIQIPRAVSIYTSPGVILSHHKTKQLLTKFSDTSKTTCSNDFNTAFSVSASSIDKSHFFFEIQDEKQDRVTHECLKLFIDYLTEESDIISVDFVMKTFLLNDIASWIIQGSPEENTFPWYDLGLDGSGEIVQVSDSGLDESHCYIRDEKVEVPSTEDWDLTGKIDNSKRKVIQYVALHNIGDRIDHSHHGSHVVGTILGKRSDDGVNEVTGLVDGIAPASKVTFFDANSDPENDMTFDIPVDISQMFYFGRQAKAFAHSASWGSNSDGGQYTSRVREVDQYFYESEDDDFIMFLAAGNDGSTNGAKIDEPSVSKNVIGVGASHSYGKNLYDNMKGFDYVASFSSRGPTEDNRIKPDIIAPGHPLLSIKAESNGECDPDYRPEYMGPSNEDKDHAGLTFKSGTSMSCPVAVGAGALVRQYFREVHSPSMDISGTLLKAVLINGAEALVGRSTSPYGSEFETSTLYDEFQGFGRVNLTNSLKHPLSMNSPDLHVEDTRVLQQGKSHEYEFDVCDTHDFRVTVVWKDPPGQVGCKKCLVNDLDLEVLYNGQTYYPNGRTSRDSRNNVERVILSRDDFSSDDSNSVIVKVKAENLGFGGTQKYSLASNGCIDTVTFVTPTPSPTRSCGLDEFEYTVEIFTNRKPEETSWILKKQGSDEVIAAVTAGEYEEDIDRLKSFQKKGCVIYGCFLFIIKDTEFDGLCCEKGMGSYSILADDEVLIESDSFVDRQKIEKFCYYGNDAIEPTTSPIALICNDDEFKYQIDIKTDLYPDETRWELLRKPRIDGVDKGNYKETSTEYVHEGCLGRGGCYSFYVNEVGVDPVEYTIKANDFIVADRESFRGEKSEGFCYSEESINSTPTYGIQTSVVGGNEGEKFDDVHSLWEYGQITQIELYAGSYGVNFIGITYESGQSFEHGDKDGEQHIISLNEDKQITNVSGRADTIIICQLNFYTNDERFGPYGSKDYGYPFEFDFGGNALVYIFGRTANYMGITQLGFVHASLPQTITDSPTAQPTSLPCGDNQFRYEIKIRAGVFPEGISWELHSIVDSVPYMTYRNQLESYSHTGCAVIDENFELRMIDRRKDGLCCYFGSGSYKLSVDNNVVVQGNHFDDAIYVGKWWQNDFFAYNKHEFSYTSTLQPTSKPIQMTCSDDEFEYRIRVRTNIYPEGTFWVFTYSNGTLIRRVDIYENSYFLEHYEHNHRGCVLLNECFEFYIEDYYGLCCKYGSGGYTVFANDVVMAEGGEGDGSISNTWSERKTFCYGPSYSQSPSLVPSSSSNPTTLTLCNENEFKYEVIVTTDRWPDDTSWELLYDDGTIIDSVEEGEYTDYNFEHVHEGCIDLDSCVIFTIFDLTGNGLCCDYGNGGYIIFADDVVMVEGREFVFEETKTFCYGPSYSLQPLSSPLVCDENDFKYEVIVTTHYYPYQTSWKLSYNDGTLIDSAEEGSYTEKYTEHVHKGCVDLDSCVIFTIFDSVNRIWEDGGYTIFVNDDVMAEGGDGYWNKQTHEFCYGPSYSLSPSSSDECEIGSNINARCGYWASIGLCEDNHVKDWMQENCANACSNCCMDYDDSCEYYADIGRCTDIYWQEWMQGECRTSCDTCDLDFTPSPTQTPSPVTCSDDQFKYEIIVIKDDGDDDNYKFSWDLYYKYPEQIDGYEVPEGYDNDYDYGIIDGYGGELPPKYEKRFYGCAVYSCFDLHMEGGYLKMYDKDKNILIAQNTERVEGFRICHYAPEPTYPIIPPIEAFITISLEFSTSQLNDEDISTVVQRSVMKILFRSQIDDENIYTIILDSSCEEESKICDISFQICEGPCGEGEEPDFLAFVGNTMNEVEVNGLLLQTIKATADHMDVAIVESLTEVSILYNFEYDAWPTTSPTTSPSFTTTQNCNTPAVVQNLFGFITGIFRPIAQAITNTADPISDVLFGVESYNSSNITCTDKMFELQIEIMTDGSPERTSWELLYENGTIIGSVVQNTYSECDTVYSYTYCLDTSCFVFNMFDSFEFKGSYNITVGDTVLAYGDSFMWWKESKRFCYPQCDDDNMFALQIELMTDNWPQETSWDLTFDNGIIVDYVEERFYSGLNTVYNHRYCLRDGCYVVTFHDHIGDGICCSYGDGLFKIKINDDNVVIREGDEFGESVRKSFCHKTEETSEEDTTTPSLFGIITDLFGYESCCTTDTTGYPTPVPTISSIPSSNPSFKPSILPSLFQSSNPSTSLQPSSNPSFNPSTTLQPSSKPSISFKPSSNPSSNPSSLCNENEFEYKVIFTTDFDPWGTSWELNYTNGTLIDNMEEGEYTDYYYEYVHEGCIDFDSCIIFTIFTNNWRFYGAYTIFVNDVVMAEGDDGFEEEETKTFCHGIGSLQPSSSPTILVCDENEFKYKFIVTTDYDPGVTFWELNYTNGTLIDSVEEGEYTNYYYEHIHEGCIELDSCIIFTIFDSFGDGICCGGGYTIFVNDDVMVKGGGGYWNKQTHEFCYGPSHSLSPSFHPTIWPTLLPTSNPTLLVCDENEFKYKVIVTTDYDPWGTSWEMNYTNGTSIDSVEQGEYTDYYYDHVHEGCIDFDSCIIFTIYDWRFYGGYTIFVNDDVMAEGNDGFEEEETKTFCYGSSYSQSPSYSTTSSSHPSSSPTVFVCDENKFKYEVVVTTDRYPYETSWELNYTNGTLIDSVEEGEYTDYYYEHVHEGCIDLDSCVIFTIFDSYGDGICCGGGYSVIVDGDDMAEGGDDGFEDEETKTFCYGPSYSFSPSSSLDICEIGSNNYENCAYWASSGFCENPDYQYWMQENCAKACSNCCADYYDDCEILASGGYCTDTTMIGDSDVTWEEFMQVTCRVSCDTCDLFDHTLSQTFSDPDIFKKKVVQTITRTSVMIVPLLVHARILVLISVVYFSFKKYGTSM